MNPFLNMGRMLNGMGDHGAESERIPAEYDLHDPCGMNDRHETGDNTQKLDDERREHPVDGKNGRHAAEGERTDVAERHKEKDKYASPAIEPVTETIRDRDTQEQCSNVYKQPPAREMMNEDERLIPVVRVNTTVAQKQLLNDDIGDTG